MGNTDYRFRYFRTYGLMTGSKIKVMEFVTAWCIMFGGKDIWNAGILKLQLFLLLGPLRSPSVSFFY